MKLNNKNLSKIKKILNYFNENFPIPNNCGRHTFSINENNQIELHIVVIVDLVNTIIVFTFDEFKKTDLSLNKLKKDIEELIKIEKDKLKLSTTIEEIKEQKKFLIFPDNTKIQQNQILEFIDNAYDIEDTVNATDDWTSEYINFDNDETLIQETLLKYNIIRLKPNGEKNQYWLGQNYQLFLKSLDDSIYS